MPCSEPPAAPTTRPHTPARGFTLVEFIVLLAVLILLVGLLVPALGASRRRARIIDCAAHLQQLGIATNLYLNDAAGCLPQVLIDTPSGSRLAPLAFGGARGTLADGVLDRLGPAERPLNKYVASSSAASPPGGSPPALDAFRSPADAGAAVPGLGTVESTFDLYGTSYALNTHLLRAAADEPVTGTLIPPTGGPMPRCATPDRTWLLGPHPVHNYDQGADRQMRWYDPARVRANLLMLDMHIATLCDIPPGAVQTTDRYTFTPAPDWPAGAAKR